MSSVGQGQSQHFCHWVKVRMEGGGRARTKLGHAQSDWCSSFLLFFHHHLDVSHPRFFQTHLLPQRESHIPQDNSVRWPIYYHLNNEKTKRTPSSILTAPSLGSFRGRFDISHPISRTRGDLTQGMTQQRSCLHLYFELFKDAAPLNPTPKSMSSLWESVLSAAQS